ncbi:TraC family protein, partial [Salmonella enterica]|uniref:TraC family protein n=1 Tax=Salmonella enterica TaxID=28901 RepID=UPI00398C2A0E
MSVGDVYDGERVAREGRTHDRREQIRETVEDDLQDSFDEYDENPWVVQFFCQEEDDAEAHLDHLRGYVNPHAQRTALQDASLRATGRPTRRTARPPGLCSLAVTTLPPLPV